VGLSGCPLRKYEDRLFPDGAEVKADCGNDAPEVIIDLPLEVVLLPMVGCFFGIMDFGGFFFKKGFGRGKSEYWDSDPNEKHQFVVEIFRHERSDGRSTPQARLDSGVYVCVW